VWLTGKRDSDQPSPLARDGSGVRATAEFSEEAQGPLALARLSERRGQTEQAEQLYEKLTERFPDHPLPYHRLGVMRAKAGRWDEAETHFQRALELNPADPELLADTGYFYYLRSQPQRAEQLLRGALEIEPNHVKSCNNLALLLGEQGRDEECLALFRRIGSEANVQANMGFIYTQRGELEKARASYSRALTLDDSLRPAAEALLQLAKFAPPQTQSAEAMSEDGASEPEGSRLVFVLERKADSGVSEAEGVKLASAEVAVASLSDTGASSEPATRGEELQSPRQEYREPARLAPQPSPPDSLPQGWQPPLPMTPGGGTFNYCRPAGAQLPMGAVPGAVMPQPPVGNLTPGPVTVHALPNQGG
jgi:Flp pilus assembly protein TadD